MAIDLVDFAAQRKCDIGVIVSTDTDLRPPLENVLERFAGKVYVVTAAWRSGNSKRRLAIQSTNIWCHWLLRADYDLVADPTDYNARS